MLVASSRTHRKMSRLCKYATQFRVARAPSRSSGDPSAGCVAARWSRLQAMLIRYAIGEVIVKERWNMADPRHRRRAAHNAARPGPWVAGPSAPRRADARPQAQPMLVLRPQGDLGRG